MLRNNKISKIKTDYYYIQFGSRYNMNIHYLFSFFKSNGMFCSMILNYIKNEQILKIKKLMKLIKNL